MIAETGTGAVRVDVKDDSLRWCGFTYSKGQSGAGKRLQSHRSFNKIINSSAKQDFWRRYDGVAYRACRRVSVSECMLILRVWAIKSG